MLVPDVGRLCNFSMLPVRKSSLDLPNVVCCVVSKLLFLRSPKSCMVKGRITLQAIAIPTALDTLFSSSDMRLNATPRSSLLELITQCKESTFPSKTPIARYISDCETVSGSLRFKFILHRPSFLFQIQRVLSRNSSPVLYIPLHLVYVIQT